MIDPRRFSAIQKSKHPADPEQSLMSVLNELGITKKDKIIIDELERVIQPLTYPSTKENAGIESSAAGSKTILMVSTYPPTKCGIGIYASQSVEALTKQGYKVTTASPDKQGDVDYRLDLKSGFNSLALRKIAKKYDQIIIQYHHDFYCDFSKKRLNGVLMPNLALAWLFLSSRNIEVVCHEFYSPPAQSLRNKIVFLSEWLKWQAAPKLVFHTRKEFDNFKSMFKKNPKRLELKEHHQDFQVYRSLSRDDARDKLGLPKDQKIFLCIGFVQPNKGFDRAVKVFNKIDPPGAKLYVVGSTRVDNEEYLYYQSHLHRLIEDHQNIHLVDKFVTDEEFDTWTCAADYVICPYREIWSSGVVGRAKLFGKKVIATAVGGLIDQLSPDDLLFETDFELAEIIGKICSKDPAAQAKATPYAVKALKSKPAQERKYKIAFVIPWYGVDISGGAEFQCRRHAEELVKSGQEVEVITTCMKQFESNWSDNFHPEGTSVINGVKVRRFKVGKRDEDRFLEAKNKLFARGSLNPEDEDTFISEMIKCHRLCDYIAANKDRYDYLIFMPYMFSTTYYGSKKAEDKAVFILCLHDEYYARLNIYEDMLNGARGILINSEPEYQLAGRLYQTPRKMVKVTGEGIDVNCLGYRDRFKKKYGLENFVLYVGRRIEDKNYRLLVEYFRSYKGHKDAPANLKLVVTGSGDLSYSWCEDIIELGFVSEEDKQDAYAAASVLIQPSINESFSIVMMEAWLAELPVLVNAQCEATKYHCIAGNGGLYFDGYEEFHECLDLVLRNRQLARRMGENGYYYVISNFNWKTVIGKYLEAFEEWS
jgi:glycosyltransferase involved in cell wall biosynthesis